MTERITATVPDYVASGIRQLATIQGRETSSAAAFILEQAIIKAIEAGIIPTARSLSPEVTTAITLIAQKKGKEPIEVMSFLLEKAIEKGIGDEISSSSEIGS